MPEQIPSIGRTVHYTLNQYDADAINKRRKDAEAHMAEHQDRSDGSQIHIGNRVQAGDIYPMVIIRVWGDQPTSAVNGQVLLDGNDTYWATSRPWGEGQGQCAWPTRV